MGLGLAMVISMCLVAPGAPAAPKRTVAVAPLHVQGELGRNWQRQLSQGVLEGLKRGDFAVIDPSELEARSSTDKDCVQPACLAQMGEQTRADYVVHPVVSARPDRHYEVQLDLVDVRQRKVIASVSSRCEVCGVAEVRESMADQSAALRKKLDDLVVGPAMLSVVSTPAQARVSIDGEIVGETPLRREMTPGRHVARAELRGHVTLEREFLAVGGVEENLEFTLTALPDQRRRYRTLGWVGLGVATGALVPGITFIALDERPATGDRCAGDNVDSAGNCRFRYDTMGPGIGLTVAGAIVAGVAVAVLLLTRDDRRRGRARSAQSWPPWSVKF